MAARLFDETIDLAEAQSGALPRLLGGEERLESAVDNLLRHTAPVSLTEISHVLPGRSSGMLPQ